MIDTPCIDICTIEERTMLCLGCGRTLDEVAAWGTMSATQRKTVMAELPARMAAAGLSLPAKVTG